MIIKDALTISVKNRKIPLLVGCLAATLSGGPFFGVRAADVVPRIPATVELPTGKSVRGTLTVKDGEAVLSAGNSNYTFSNGEQIIGEIQEKGFPLHLETAKPPGAGDYYLKITKFSPQSVGVWKRSVKAVVPTSENARLAEVQKSMAELGAATRENITTAADSQDWRGVLDKYRDTRSLIANVYTEVKDDSTRGELARLTGNLSTEERTFAKNKLADPATSSEAESYLNSLPAIEKRFYSMNDNYRPEIYPMISLLCNSCVAIFKKDAAVPLGSGVIIGKNLVLTCRHNVEKNAAASFEQSEYSVWTDFEDRRFSAPPENTICECREVYRSEAFDFVLLEIRRQDNHQGLDRKPLVLSAARVQRWTPIFLVGYPQGNRRTVHDGSWVLFPHRLLNNAERGAIESDIAAEYLQEQTSNDSRVRSDKAAIQASSFMKDRYGALDPNDGQQYTFHADGQEYIGAECDTFEGDSGAPAITRESGKVIGILFKGLSDMGASANTAARKPAVAGRPGARNHERIIPIANIVSDAKVNFKDWAEYHVGFE